MDTFSSKLLKPSRREEGGRGKSERKMGENEDEG
jgi:hypothetical protein